MPDQRGYLLPEERRILLHRYAPVLALFPERKAQAPYPDEGDAIYTVRGSYHPRSTAFFLKHGKVRYGGRRLLRDPQLFFRPRPLDDELTAAEQSVTPKDVEKALHDPEFLYDPRYAGLIGDELKAAVHKRLVQQRLGQRIRGFDQPLRQWRNLGQWNKYFEQLVGDDTETRRCVVYGRLVQGRAPLDENLDATDVLLKQGPGLGPYDVSRTRVALQYWFQYYYDDWANRHEGDWEGITILLELSEDVIRQGHELTSVDLLEGITLQDVGYSVHEDGYRRMWQDVQKTRDGRPLVYVARGSSASYFAWRLEGYPASARVGLVEKLALLPGRLLRGRRIFGRRWDAQYSARFTGRDPKNTDWVAADPEPLDRLDESNLEPLERWVPTPCRGVRRRPDFEAEAGCDEATYHLETDDLFWLEMVQEYGVQWGEDSFFPGAKGPGGISQAEREKDRADIHQLALLETAIKHSLDDLNGIRYVATEAIPELNAALQRLRPKNLRGEKSLPNRVRRDVNRTWANLLREHPEAWIGGPGLWQRLVFRWSLYPGIVSFLTKRGESVPLLRRDDPLYHLKTLLAQVRRVRYELQLVGSKWDNAFAWARYVCQADTFYYGRPSSPPADRADFFRYLDCVDADMSME